MPFAIVAVLYMYMRIHKILIPVADHTLYPPLQNFMHSLELCVGPYLLYRSTANKAEEVRCDSESHNPSEDIRLVLFPSFTWQDNQAAMQRILRKCFSSLL